MEGACSNSLQCWIFPLIPVFSTCSLCLYPMGALNFSPISKAISYAILEEEEGGLLKYYKLGLTVLDPWFFGAGPRSLMCIKLGLGQKA